jgi:hypothetical protein
LLVGLLLLAFVNERKAREAAIGPAQEKMTP